MKLIYEEDEPPKEKPIRKMQGKTMGGASLEDIGSEFGVTKERARQMTNDAMFKAMRRLADERGIRITNDEIKERLKTPEAQDAINDLMKQVGAMEAGEEPENMGESNLRLAEIAGFDIEDIEDKRKK